MVGPIRGPSGFQLLKLVEVRDASATAGASTVTEYHGRHILVRVDDHQTDAAAKAKIDTLRARIAELPALKAPKAVKAPKAPKAAKKAA